MDHADIKALEKWLSAEVKGVPGVIFGVSESYPSSVGAALLGRVFPGEVLPVYVGVKVDPWKIDLAEERIRRSAPTFPEVHVVSLNETVDDLEDKFPALRKSRPHLWHVQYVLGSLADSYKWPVVWCGSRSSLLRFRPQVSGRVIVPFGDLSQEEVRQVGAFLSLSDEWVSKWDGVPSGWYASDLTRSRRSERLTSLVEAHREDWEGSPVSFSESSSKFLWMGWTPEDVAERVQLLEIAEMASRQSAAALGIPRRADEVQMVGSEVKMSLAGTPPENISVLGSVRITANCEVTKASLFVTGISDSGEKVFLKVQALSEKVSSKLAEKLNGVSHICFPASFSSGEGNTIWYLLSLSSQGVKSFITALEDVLAFYSILPDEIQHDPLSEEELESRAKRSAQLAKAPRPTRKG